MGKSTAFAKVFLPEHIESDDSILILHGGEDISPSLYGQIPAKQTGASDVLSPRDKLEADLAREAIRRGIPVF